MILRNASLHLFCRCSECSRLKIKSDWSQKKTLHNPMVKKNQSRYVNYNEHMQEGTEILEHQNISLRQRDFYFYFHVFSLITTSSMNASTQTHHMHIGQHPCQNMTGTDIAFHLLQRRCCLRRGIYPTSLGFFMRVTRNTPFLHINTHCSTKRFDMCWFVIAAPSSTS